MSVTIKKGKKLKDSAVNVLEKVSKHTSTRDVEILTAKGPGGVRQICGVFNICQHAKRIELENFLAEKGFSEFNLEVWEVR